MFLNTLFTPTHRIPSLENKETIVSDKALLISRFSRTTVRFSSVIPVRWVGTGMEPLSSKGVGTADGNLVATELNDNSYLVVLFR